MRYLVLYIPHCCHVSRLAPAAGSRPCGACVGWGWGAAGFAAARGGARAAAATRPPTHTHRPPPDEAASIKSPALAALDQELSGALSELLAGGGFEGKAGSASRALRVMGAKAGSVALAGLGPAAKAGAVVEWGASPYQARGGRGWAGGGGGGDD